MKEENKIKIGDILEGRLSSNASGSAYLVSTDLPKDIYLNKNNTNHALHLDNVRIEVIPGDGRSLEGKVIEIVERFRTEFVGQIQISPKFAFFVPDSNKLAIDFFIPLNKLMGATDGQKVIVKMTEWKDGAKNPNGEVIRVLGNAGEHETEIHSIMSEFNLPDKFPYEVLEEAEAISGEITQEEINRRLDYRDILTFTIDSETARDLDDALSIRWIDGKLEVGVHIADVSHYVKTGSEIYKEAYSRGTSIYLVDRCIPMLPEKLSNDLCSLNSNTDKLVYSFIFNLDNNGKVINESFNKGIINSNYRLTYTEVQKVIEGDETYSNELKNGIIDLNKFANKLNKIRSKNNPLSFKGSEVKFKLDSNNKPLEIIYSEQTAANKLIEEFMVLTNMRVCEFISKKEITSIHRTHSTPDITKINDLKLFVESMGYILDLSNEDRIKESLNDLLKQVKDTPEENIVNNLITRCMSKAIYQTNNIGHYGLGLQHYVHVTSPIRRFCDLKIHEQLNNILPNNGYIR